MGARILIIEDNTANLDLMTYLLNAFGHQTLVARDGEAGLEAARRKALDLIICDIQMPKMDGFEVARRLKTHPALRKIPLIAITAFAMVGDRDKILAAGFDGYIAKPITPETFVSQVETFIESFKSAPRWPNAAGRANLPPIARKGVTILVVDNSPLNIELARSTLEPFGYDVVTASGVSDGLRLARQAPPDLILSDVHMPEQDGFDFIREVKSAPQLRRIPFVFISSTSLGKSDEMRAHSLGAAKFISRPIEPQLLLAEIDKCLQSRNKDKS